MIFNKSIVYDTGWMFLCALMKIKLHLTLDPGILSNARIKSDSFCWSKYIHSRTWSLSLLWVYFVIMASFCIPTFVWYRDLNCQPSVLWRPHILKCNVSRHSKVFSLWIVDNFCSVFSFSSCSEWGLFTYILPFSVSHK